MTDKQLRSEVEQELEFEPEVDAAGIGVSAEAGVIRLTGYVCSLAQKLAAERAARRVYSARAVVDDLEVRLDSRDERSDLDLAEEAVRTVNSLVAIPPDLVRLVVRDGYILLEGEVEWKYQSDMVENALRHLRGVRGIRNHLTIQPQERPGGVVELIRNALQRHAALNAADVRVEVFGGQVVLEGNVGSDLERELAVRTAWRAAGVANVDDRLTVQL